METKPFLFKDWLKKGQDSSKALCSTCHKAIQLSTAGRSALKGYNNGKKKDAVNKISKFFKPHGSTPKEKNRTTVQSAQTFGCQQTISQLFVSSGIYKADIMWVLKSVVSGFSYRSFEELTDVFSIMFSDSDTVKGFQASKTKVMYVATYGIAPHFNYILKAYT